MRDKQLEVIAECLMSSTLDSGCNRLPENDMKVT